MREGDRSYVVNNPLMITHNDGLETELRGYGVELYIARKGGSALDFNHSPIDTLGGTGDI